VVTHTSFTITHVHCNAGDGKKDCTHWIEKKTFLTRPKKLKNENWDRETDISAKYDHNCAFNTNVFVVASNAFAPGWQLPRVCRWLSGQEVRTQGYATRSAI
jgi:hypothetical protein